MVDNCWLWLKSWCKSKNESQQSIFGTWANLRLENMQRVLDLTFLQMVTLKKLVPCFILLYCITCFSFKLEVVGNTRLAFSTDNYKINFLNFLLQLLGAIYIIIPL
jgi:hypothetical protein